MTDYKEEQLNEVEVLQSIYPDELQVLETEPYHQILITLSPEATDIEEDYCACVTLKFTYTETYPDELPIIEVEDSVNLEEEDNVNLIALLDEQGKENIGMPMLFVMCSATLEWLNSTVEKNKVKREEEKERFLREEEAAAVKKFEGTHVTIETFIAWKASFDAEKALMKNKNTELTSKKLTGRELFENNEALNDDQDISFLPEGEEDVQVDESLFDDLDDLDLEDDDLEDS